MRVLHVGCGRKRYDAPALFASVGLEMKSDDPVEVIHLDADDRLNPDLVCTLGVNDIPLEDDSVDLVIAWHVLEHVGMQGNAEEWFFAWEELYRVLNSKGWIYAECPYYDSIWAWSDPTHTRVISEHSMIFFAQDSYRIPESMISPYRIHADFRWIRASGLEQGWAIVPDTHDPKHRAIRFALQAIKPLRPWWED